MATTATANHAFRSLKFELDPVFRSPTSLQYKDYQQHHRTKQSLTPHFKPRFTFKSKDRAKTLGHPDFKKAGIDDPLMPLYPYGANVAFQEANFGLYGGATIRSGNKISKGRNKGKTLRHWFPNVRLENVRSEALNRELRIPITARVMRTIRKCGGLDEYVCGEKPARIKELGLLGWRLRWLVMTSPKKLEEYAQQRKELGLEGKSPLEESFEDVWNDPERKQKLIKQQEVAWQSLRDAAKRFETHVQNQWINAGEKHPYKIPELQTLKKEAFTQFQLPATLPEYYHDEVKVHGLGKPSPDTNEVADHFRLQIERNLERSDPKRRPLPNKKKAISKEDTKLQL
jgi:large subunit ribosomal protein L28